jgi:hypothetical protein
MIVACLPGTCVLPKNSERNGASCIGDQEIPSQASLGWVNIMVPDFILEIVGLSQS